MMREEICKALQPIRSAMLEARANRQTDESDHAALEWGIQLVDEMSALADDPRAAVTYQSLTTRFARFYIDSILWDGKLGDVVQSQLDHLKTLLRERE